MPRIRVSIGPDGPVIDLSIWVGRVVAHALVASGQAVPPAQTICALIDTGADRTAVHPGALASIGSPPAGTIRVRRPGSTAASRWVNLHDLRLAFGGVSTASSRRVGLSSRPPPWSPQTHTSWRSSVATCSRTASSFTTLRAGSWSWSIEPIVPKSNRDGNARRGARLSRGHGKQ
jgi:hypothetical protein